MRICSKNSGFTLIELLVVVAIIGILACLIFPAVNRAKVLTRLAHCQSNIRQTLFAAQMYADDNGSMVSQSWSLDLGP